jgi:hypothetical protein
MITIPVATDPVSGALIPSLLIPADAIAVICNGTVYTVYQPGDRVPQQDSPPVE